MSTLGQWLWYWLQAPGCPGLQHPGPADVIIVQAFGRNHLHDNDLARLRKFHDDNGSIDAYTLEWCRSHVEPGNPNRSLAMELMDAVHHLRVPVIAQWEVIVACPVDWYVRHQSAVTCLWPSATPGEYFSTRDVLAASFEVMDRFAWKHPVVLAHAGQAMRVAMMVRKMRGEWPSVLPNLPNDFDRESVQPWTRNRLAWMAHEFLARGHHLVHRWV